MNTTNTAPETLTIQVASRGTEKAALAAARKATREGRLNVHIEHEPTNSLYFERWIVLADEKL